MSSSSNPTTRQGPAPAGFRACASRLSAARQPSSEWTSEPWREMRPTGVGSGRAVTKRTVIPSTVPPRSGSGQQRSQIAATSGGGTLPRTPETLAVNSSPGRLLRGAPLGQRPEALRRDREDHVLGVGRAAVVEGHALAQRRLHRARVDPTPFGRRHRLPRQGGPLALVVDEPLEDRVEQARADVGALAHHVERARGHEILHADREHGPRIPLGEGGRRRRRERGEAGGGPAEGGGRWSWGAPRCPSDALPATPHRRLRGPSLRPAPRRSRGAFVKLRSQPERGGARA